METIIVYLIIGVIIAVNVVKNYKKEIKKNKQRDMSVSKPNTVNNKRSTPPPFSKKLEKKQDSYNGIPKPNKISEERKYPEISKTIENSEAISNTSRLSVPKNKVMFEELEAVETHNQLDIDLSTTDDLKKAFIYSTIFNRKY